VGSSPDFTDAIDLELIRGEVDLAVHSAKDLPIELDHRLDLVACPRRADPRDCLVTTPRARAARLPHRARIGSSSLRRRAQLLRWRSDLDVVEIRGNVDTRIELVRRGEIDAAILAVAGISRLGRSNEIGRVLPARTFLPAPAQGALAVVVRTGDSTLASQVRQIDHRPTHSCVSAERTFAGTLGGDCRMPLGALARIHGPTISLTGEVLTPDGQTSLRRALRGPMDEAERIAARLGKEMRDVGVLDLISASRR